MIRNCVTDNDLKSFYPNLVSQIWAKQPNYQKQIDTAYSILMDDLHNAGINPTLIESVDLTGTNNIKPAFITVANVTGSAIHTDYERRIIVDTKNISGSLSVFIDGCTTVNKSDITESDWNEILEIDVNETDEMFTDVTEQSYPWIRYRIVPDSQGASGTVSITATTTLFDDCVAHKALALILRSFVREQNDQWDYQRTLEEKDYSDTFNAAKIRYDANNNGSIDDQEAETKMLDITFVR
jgi:hypothetical protein